MISLRSIVLSAGICAVAAASAAPAAITPVGTWNGHLVGLSYTPTKEAQAHMSADKIKEVVPGLKTITIKLVIVKNGTYTATTSVGGSAKPPSKGTWKFKGKTLTLTPADKRSPEVGTIAANGKSVSFDLPSDLLKNGVKGHAVFAKAK